MQFKISSWDKRNVDVLPSGEVCVREAMQRLGSAVSSDIMKAWTVRCQTTDVVWHYVLFFALTGNTLAIYDENLSLIQDFSYRISIQVSDASLSLVEDQLIISSPDLPTVWGVVGSGVVKAVSQASVNTMTTALENIPNGLSVSWAGRCVIADRQTMYFSDALYPRTYVGQNAIDPPGGVIYGMHVNAGGALIVCTASGVYALPEDAAASGQIVIGVFSKLTDYQCTGYQNTASCKGRVYGLTKRGYVLIDTQGSDEIMLDESQSTWPALSTGPGRLTFDDYREGRIFAGQDGLYIHMANRYVKYVNLSTGLESWWASFTSTTFANLGGVGFDNDGKELFYASGLLTRNGNNGIEAVVSLVSGRLKLPSNQSPVIRSITFATDSYSGHIFSINAVTKTITPKRISPIIGTDLWDLKFYTNPKLQSRLSNWAIRGDDLLVCVGVAEHPHLIPMEIDVEFKGPGKKRETN